jgi:glycosyltransferase involved in cell wall biosynthesis/GT2 family glycosyltransferase
MKPLSLIMPIYNNVDMAIEYLDITLSTATSIDQIILYSNGTTDEGNEKLKQYAKSNPLVELYIRKEGIGFAKAVNEGFKLCKNEYMFCISSDVYLEHNWEERLQVLCDKEENGLIGPVMSDDFILGCCFIARKSVLNKVGLLNEGFGLGYEEDVEFSYRIKNNGYNLGYDFYKDDLGKSLDTGFPIRHIQGVSFYDLKKENLDNLISTNKQKHHKFLQASNVIVLKDLLYDEVKKIVQGNEVYVVVNKSGDEFEKIRFDNDIIAKAHIFECLPEMNIDVLISSITKGKSINGKTTKLTWLAKYDDYSSMGILSQRILEQLDKRDYNLACKAIIGTTETENPLIYDLLSKTPKKDIGIMFSYPDMAEYLNEFKTKVIYTGVDTTDEAGNFVENANKVDYLFTPSKLSKKRIENMGVKKPVFVLPHGIDPEVFKYTERTKTDIFKFLYVGECSDRKGIFHLLKAFTDLFKNNPKVELHIKSNTDMLFYNSKEVQDIIKDYKNIFWHIGNIGHDEVIKLYKECHAYVYPSRGDSFGMTLLEAMACGLPIITTKLPGATDVVDGKVTYIKSKIIPVQGHPWFKGEWGEPDLEDLKSKMKSLYENYDTSKLKEYSDFIRENYSWEKIVDKFEQEILPKLIKPTKVLTLLTSYDRPHHIKNVINSLKDIQEPGIINDIYIVENSHPEYKAEALKTIKENIDSRFKIHNSEFNMGQRAAMLQMFDDMDIDNYDFIQFTDQDNLFNEPISTYCNILNQFPDKYVATGYMSKEHEELGWIETKFGRLNEKRACRAGHMVMRAKDIKNMMPIHLDRMHNNSYVNSSWNAGLDWELTYWNPKSPGAQGKQNFVLCVPGGVLHKGTDSTMYDWPVEENEYTLEELKELRKNKF